MNKAFLIAYFLFSFFFFTFFASGIVDSQDGLQYLAIARRIYYDRTFEMPDADYPLENIHMSVTKNSEGKRYSPTGLGFTLSLLPAVVVEDIFLRTAGEDPIEAFPLQSDWPVLLVASMTNAFWGALFVSILFLYLKSFNISQNHSAILAFLLTISTNIFPYTKHVFAHMMFLTCMLATFYFIRRYGLYKKRINLFFAGVSFGLLIISYNPFFLLTVPAMGIYHLLLTKRPFYFSWFKELAKDTAVGFTGVLPFFLLYRWFNSVRFGMGSATGYGEGGIPLPTLPPLYVIFDGGWNVLFSAGRSIFLFSPLLLLIILFWHKIPRQKLKPELTAFSIQFFIFYYFVATLMGGVDYLLWHGDSSWGPRYMLPILPGFLVIIGVLIMHVSRKVKIFVVLPLKLLGIFIQLCGILLPYQIRFQGLQTDTQFNGRNFNVYEYGNIIPRYSPVLTMSKTLVKRMLTMERLYDRGEYDLILKDGFDRPFRPTPDEAWREILPIAELQFTDREKNIDEIRLLIKNHQQIPESSYSAQLLFSLNEASLSADAVIPVDTEQWVTVAIPQDQLKDLNTLRIEPSYIGTSSARIKKQQIIFLQELQFNEQKQNLFLIDYPYVSPISQSLYDAEYSYYGNMLKDPWEIWHMHSAVYEETFDLWWLRPLHYWDLPKRFFGILFIIQITGLVIPLYILIKKRNHK